VRLAEHGQDAGVPTHVALLRGINLAGRNRVAMADLRAVVEALGHTAVGTYIQSGNVVFTAAGGNTTAVAAELERAIADTIGVPAPVVVLTRDELAEVVAANPYPDEPNPKLVHVVFTPDKIGAKAAATVAEAADRARAKGSADTVEVSGRVLYLHTPGGIGRSELAIQLSRLTVPAGTARNWATVGKLLALCDAG
jgi:uncharacterized protein (DUF1697 family)